jgi:hypothetical protein
MDIDSTLSQPPSFKSEINLLKVDRQIHSIVARESRPETKTPIKSQSK